MHRLACIHRLAGAYFRATTAHKNHPLCNQTYDNATTMADEPFPDSVKDFVFDLHDASRRSFIPSEQAGLYQSNFREITAKVSV